MKQVLLFLLLMAAFTALKAQTTVDTAGIHFKIPAACKSLTENEAVTRTGEIIKTLRCNQISLSYHLTTTFPGSFEHKLEDRHQQQQGYMSKSFNKNSSYHILDAKIITNVGGIGFSVITYQQHDAVYIQFFSDFNTGNRSLFVRLQYQESAQAEAMALAKEMMDSVKY
ncbi:hypothetical protein [Chitinophaga sp. Cy-1792]|uniref:hypothetical protein n=1 Tax=Chitinophaga sp. Cy-1792 TaxID=2608339 RepID=UPI00141F1F96|nr:hypothetical protein [Chitinophaga sp. Cy-1792]NIG57085.1 hypothetical protein [Chitinophaga sp. Cy-1792]